MYRQFMIPVRIAVALPIILAAFIAATACRGSYEGSQLTDLTTTQQLKQKFEQDAGKVRVIALLSPN